ncbi:MAG TPA: hypothetical protein PKH07_08120 [bacterium]|nr:hypothetical protein [bacterium]
MRRAERKRETREQAEREKKEAEARQKYLDSLRGKENEIWEQIEKLILTRQPRRYDEAPALPRDLRDSATMQDRKGDYDVRLDALKQRHSQKSALLRRLKHTVVTGIAADGLG